MLARCRGWSAAWPSCADDVALEDGTWFEGTRTEDIARLGSLLYKLPFILPTDHDRIGAVYAYAFDDCFFVDDASFVPGLEGDLQERCGDPPMETLPDGQLFRQILLFEKSVSMNQGVPTEDKCVEEVSSRHRPFTYFHCFSFDHSAPPNCIQPTRLE